jgi:hypothetical protein
MIGREKSKNSDKKLLHSDITIMDIELPDLCGEGLSYSRMSCGRAYFKRTQKEIKNGSKRERKKKAENVYWLASVQCMRVAQNSEE